MAATKTPRTQSELEDFAKETYRNLIAKYENDGRRFIDIKDDTGVIYRCAGSVSLLLLINNFEIVDEKNKGLQIVLNEFDEVMKHVTEKGYDATPLVAENATKKFFGVEANPRNYYTDTLSWVLSFSIQIRHSFRLTKLKINQEVLEKAAKTIQNVLELICEAACAKGGWNFSNGCTEPDLYYSFAVSEALADFGDYVLGETPEIFGKTSAEEAMDKELVEKWLGKELTARVEEKRKLTAKWLIDNFLKTLGNDEINPANKALQGSDHILLYYTYFVIDMLIICKADEYYENEQVNKYIEHGIYLSRIDYDKAAADTEWFNDPVASALSLTWENHGDSEALRRMKSDTRSLEEPGLVPLSLRCNALYAYYIAEGADRKMADLFEELFQNRHEDTGLWDSLKYNLMITERAIEAIVDYQDYLIEFEASKATTEKVEHAESKIDASFRNLIHECIEEYLSAKGQNLPSKAGSQNLKAANKSTLTEGDMLTILTSALATGEKLMKGVENPAYKLDKETFEKFCRGFNKFLVTWLCAEMQGNNKENPETLRQGARKNLDNLLLKLSPFLSSDMTIDAGDMFDYLKDETVGHHTRNG